MKSLTIEIGTKFKKLTVKEITSKRIKARSRRVAICECECGTVVERQLAGLVAGRTTSCGCSRLTHGKSKTLEYRLWNSAKQRAAANNLPFNITIDDIVIPDVCPLLGIEIIKRNPREPQFHGCRDNSPSLDRLIPSLGYVKGNIIVISNRANTIKNSSTLDELMLITKNLHRIMSDV